MCLAFRIWEIFGDTNEDWGCGGVDIGFHGDGCNRIISENSVTERY